MNPQTHSWQRFQCSFIQELSVLHVDEAIVLKAHLALEPDFSNSSDCDFSNIDVDAFIEIWACPNTYIMRKYKSPEKALRIIIQLQV